MCLIPGLGRSPGEGNGYLLQHFCLQNSMDRGVWRLIVHRVAKSQTWLSTHTHIHTHTHTDLKNTLNSNRSQKMIWFYLLISYKPAINLLCKIAFLLLAFSPSFLVFFYKLTTLEHYIQFTNSVCFLFIFPNWNVSYPRAEIFVSFFHYFIPSAWKIVWIVWYLAGFDIWWIKKPSYRNITSQCVRQGSIWLCFPDK